MFYRIGSIHNGFASDLINALSQLWAFDLIERDRTDGKSDIAVVDWTDPNWFYAESELVHGTSNVWEYYFQQPMGVGVDQIQGAVMDGIAEYDLRHDQSAEKQACLPEIRALIKKYIRVKDHLQERVGQITDSFSGKRVLGVHFRDTDMPYIHGRSTSVYTAYDNIMDRRSEFDMVYLATECQEALGKFKEWASDNSIELVHSDCFRVAPGVVHEFLTSEEVQNRPESYIKTVAKQLHIHEYAIQNAPRPLHKYLLGLEVMTDILVLARCNLLLRGYSGVANSAVFFSEQPPENIFGYS